MSHKGEVLSLLFKCESLSEWTVSNLKHLMIFEQVSCLISDTRHLTERLTQVSSVCFQVFPSNYYLVCCAILAVVFRFSMCFNYFLTYLAQSNILQDSGKDMSYEKCTLLIVYSLYFLFSKVQKNNKYCPTVIKIIHHISQ